MSTQSEFVRASMIVRKAWTKVYTLANAEDMPGFPTASRGLHSVALHILRQQRRAAHMEEEACKSSFRLHTVSRHTDVLMADSMRKSFARCVVRRSKCPM